jgi:hypothetical protein
MVMLETVQRLVNGEDWIAPTLQNDWVNYGTANYNAAGYRKVGNVVHLRGLLKDGTVGTVPAFTLPEGYRPAKQEIYGTVSNGAFGEVRVLTNGEVRLVVGDNTWFCVDGITFTIA